MGSTDKNIVAASSNPKIIISRHKKIINLKMFNFLHAYVIFSFVSYMINAIWTCSVFCEDGKIPCGGYGASCEGFRGSHIRMNVMTLEINLVRVTHFLQDQHSILDQRILQE